MTFSICGKSGERIRQKALELADSMPGEDATRRWLERMPQFQPEARADLIAMLGRRGDKTSFPAVREKIKSGDKSVRLEAVAAAVKLGGAEVFADVWPLIQTEDEDQVRVVKQALLDFSIHDRRAEGGRSPATKFPTRPESL